MGTSKPSQRHEQGHDQVPDIMLPKSRTEAPACATAR